MDEDAAGEESSGGLKMIEVMPLRRLIAFKRGNRRESRGSKREGDQKTPRVGGRRSEKFPQKLWQMVDNCQTGAIGWADDHNSDDGTLTPIFIQLGQFQKEFLTGGANLLDNSEESISPDAAAGDESRKQFKTKNIPSFIRQLNLYGFRKVTENKQLLLESPQYHVYKNVFFRKGRPDLLVHINRTYPEKDPNQTPGTRRNSKRRPDTPIPMGQLMDYSMDQFEEAERAVMNSILAEASEEQKKLDENENYGPVGGKYQESFEPLVMDHNEIEEIQEVQVVAEEATLEEQKDPKWIAKAFQALENQRFGRLSFGSQKKRRMKPKDYPEMNCQDIMDPGLKPSSMMTSSPTIIMLPEIAVSNGKPNDPGSKLPSQIMASPPDDDDNDKHDVPEASPVLADDHEIANYKM